MVILKVNNYYELRYNYYNVSALKDYVFIFISYFIKKMYIHFNTHKII